MGISWNHLHSKAISQSDEQYARVPHVMGATDAGARTYRLGCTWFSYSSNHGGRLVTRTLRAAPSPVLHIPPPTSFGASHLSPLPSENCVIAGWRRLCDVTRRPAPGTLLCWDTSMLVDECETAYEGAVAVVEPWHRAYHQQTSAIFKRQSAACALCVGRFQKHVTNAASSQCTT